MAEEHVIEASEVGNWFVPLGGFRVPICEVDNSGLVGEHHVGRRVFRRGDTYVISDEGKLLV